MIPIRVGRIGGLGNTMFQYMFARKLADMVPGAVVTNVRLPEFGIEIDDCEMPENFLTLDPTHHVDVLDVAHMLREGVYSGVWMGAYVQRLEYFADREALTDLFPSAQAVDSRLLDEKALVINVRANEILRDLHVDYGPVPVDFFSQVADESGLAPVLIGQLGDNPYSDELRKRFSGCPILQSESPAADFELIRSAKNIVFGVSTFSWLGAWLSPVAEQIFMPISGIFNPLQRPDIDLVPVSDARYRFFDFPVGAWHANAEQLASLVSGEQSFPELQRAEVQERRRAARAKFEQLRNDANATKLLALRRQRDRLARKLKAYEAQTTPMVPSTNRPGSATQSDVRGEHKLALTRADSEHGPFSATRQGVSVADNSTNGVVAHGAGPREVSAEDERALRYARGFLMLPLGRPEPASVSGWARYPMPGYMLFVDPRVPVAQATGIERDVWLAGDAFDSERGIFNDVAPELATGDLLEALDRLSGRFLLVVRHKSGRFEVYHDAMGARSIFYAEGIVASHASLVADQIGTGLRDWVIPFITSRGWAKRDVKFLPGLDSSFEGVTQLTPNTRLVLLPSIAVERYWPREPLRPTTDESAVGLLVSHMRGLSDYLRARSLHPVLGLSAGRDSRCVIAGTSDLSPSLFTFVRGAQGSMMSSDDSRIALRLAEAAGLELELIKIETPPHLNRASSVFAREFRINTGHVRGNSQGWVEHFWDSEPSRDPQVFVRGFGGEVMRGFGGSRPVTSASANALSNTYDVNAGSVYTRRAFARFIDVTSWQESSFHGCSLSDVFYWEHRMGIWGSSSFTEADMAFRGFPAYNSRNLFSAFWGLDADVRIDGRHFKAAAAQLSPTLSQIAYSS